MNSIECFVVRDGAVLMTRESGSGWAPLATDVAPGESPIEASVRLIARHLSPHPSPSCAGIYFRLTPGHVTEYGLAFVAEAHSDTEPARPGEYNWFTPSALAGAADVSPVYKQLAGRFLSADHPLAVVLVNEDRGPIEASRVEAISTIDPAVLSPLVFAHQS